MAVRKARADAPLGVALQERGLRKGRNGAEPEQHDTCDPRASRDVQLIAKDTPHVVTESRAERAREQYHQPRKTALGS